MSFNISSSPMNVLIDGHDSEGSLVLSDGQLAAVFVRLDGEHHDPEHKGLWHLEAGFGHCSTRYAPLFKTMDEARAWVSHTLRGKTFKTYRETVHASPIDRVADYRRRADDARKTAEQMSLNDMKHQLLELAQHLELLAEGEEFQTAPVLSAKPKA